MWDQVRVDHGKEFFLTLFMQEKLADHRYNTERLAYKQTSSTKVSVGILHIFDCTRYVYITIKQLAAFISNLIKYQTAG